jgi:outer membrane receptor protein involved in Fe transport
MAVLGAEAQNINGRVVDEDDAPIPYATVVAMQLPDSTFLSGVTTDNDGRFTFDMACDLLKITFVGYEPRFVSKPKGNLGTLKMNVAASQIQEVTIAAKRPEITSLPDRTVVGVESTLLSSSADGIDMLRKTPGLLVDGQNHLSVIGQGSPIVYINNRRVYSMDEVYNLNPQNIKSIEIIHNPSSQYEADATAIVKIVTIRRNDDFSVRIGGTLTKARRWSERAFADVTLSKNKFSANFYYGFNGRNTHTLNNEDVMGYSMIEHRAYNLSENQGHNAKLMLEYALNPKMTIGLQSNNNFGNGTSLREQGTHFVADNHTDFKTVTNTNDKSLRSNNTLFFNYDIDSLGQNLNVTLDYTYNRYNDEDAFRNIVDGSESQGVLNLNKGYGNTGIYVGSVDYTLPFRNGKTTLSTGAKYSLIQTDNHVDLSGNNNLLQHYHSDESNAAAYASVAHNFSDKWSATAGLRFEYVDRHNTLNDVPQVDYTKPGLFPNATVQYKPSQGYAIGASYSKRIARPSLDALNPSMYIDSLLITQGNPNLINTHIHSVQVFASFPISLSVRFGYNYEINPIYRELYQSVDNLDVGESRYRNGDHTQSLFGSIAWNGNVTKWWYLYSSIYFGRNYYEKEEDGVLKQNNKNYAMLSVGNMLTLPYDVKFNLNFYYGTPYPSHGVTVKELWSLSASLEKSFLNNNLTVRLSANDIFNSMLYWQQSVLRGNSLVFFDSDGRNIMLNVTYKFGKSKVRLNSRSVSEEERERL